MGKMQKFMVVHNDPEISWEKVEANWGKLANIEEATWVRTYFNRELGIRYCFWLAPNRATLTAIFTDLNISFDTIVEVQETCPDLWGEKWQEHLAAEAEADTLGF
jgi:hypothetical protein